MYVSVNHHNFLFYQPRRSTSPLLKGSRVLFVAGNVQEVNFETDGKMK